MVLVGGQTGHVMETSARLLRLLGLLQVPRDWTGRALAERLDVDVRTVRRWRHEGRLPPALQIGRSVRWKRGEIEGMVP